MTIPQSGLIYPHPMSPAQERINRCKNPSLQYDAAGQAPTNFSPGWDAGWSSTSALVSTGWTAWDGDRSLRVQGTKDNNATARNFFLNIAGWDGEVSSIQPVTPGAGYSWSAHFNIINPVAHGSIYMGLNFWTSPGVGQAGAVGNDIGTLNGTQYASVSGTIPAGKYYVQPYIWMWSDSANDVVDFYVDGFLWEDTATVGTFFSGDSAGARWTGTSQISSSARLPGRDNLCASPNSLWTQSYNSNCTVDSFGASPPYANRLTVHFPGAGFGQTNYTSATTFKAAAGDRFTFRSDKFRISNLTNGTSTATSITYGIDWFSDSTYLGGDYQSLTTSAQGEGVAFTTAAAPAGTTYASLTVATAGSQNGTVTVEWGECLVERGTTVGPYFSGATPGCSWKGTANNSWSFRPDYIVAFRDEDGEQGIPTPAYTQTVDGDRASVLMDASIDIPGVGPRPVCFVDQPYTDDFNRADDTTPPIGPDWVNYVNGTDLAALRNNHVEALAAAADGPAQHYFFTGLNKALAPPCMVAFDIVSLATAYDNYVELMTVPDSGVGQAYLEIGFWYRAAWGDGYRTNIWGFYPGFNGAIQPSRVVTPAWAAGDRVALAYDGTTVFTFRRPSGQTTWQLLQRGLAPPYFANKKLYPTFWWSNYDAADGGGSAWDNFYFGRF